MSTPIHFEPAVPDGPDRPWTRGRRTRWWLVVPADLLAAGLATAFGSAAVHSFDGLVREGLGAEAGVVLGWLAAWVLGRRRRGGDHLETASEGVLVLAMSFVGWAVARRSVASVSLGWALMAGVMCVVFLWGWRYLYGFVKAHDSLTPRPVLRRMEAAGRAQDAEGPAESS